MSTAEQYQRELDSLSSRASGSPEISSSESEWNTFQEKLSEAKAAFQRLKHHGDDAFDRLARDGHEAWGEFTARLRAVQDFLESRRDGRDEGES